MYYNYIRFFADGQKKFRKPDITSLMHKQTELYLRNIVSVSRTVLFPRWACLPASTVAGTARHAIILTGIVYAFCGSILHGSGELPLGAGPRKEYEGKGETSGTGPFTAGLGDVFIHIYPSRSFIRSCHTSSFGLSAAIVVPPSDFRCACTFDSWGW